MDGQPPPRTVSGSDKSASDAPQNPSTYGISSWAKSLKIPQSLAAAEDDTSNTGKSKFARFTSGLGLNLSPKASTPDDNSKAMSIAAQPGFIGNFTKGLVDSSRNAVKAVQVKARHAVSQNKRRYQEGGFDLDMTYITENIIAMGFPAGDMSSGLFGYVEGFYRNHMEEVIKFFEIHHKGKYKVYNLCSGRLYDASLFEGKVASFPFDDHNCPPIHLITLFCQSAYSWLKEDIENVVVVHCKAGMARTGLMISSLLLFLKFFPTAEESIDYYNQKRCFDGKGLVLPSQIRYVKYFERILTSFSGKNQPGRRCMLRGFRLHKCHYWIRPSITVSDHRGVLFSTKKHPRTKDLTPEDFWFTAPKKGIMVFALPGEPGLTELFGDFKIHFHDRQGDFYGWLNTTMMENRTFLSTSDLDGFEKNGIAIPVDHEWNRQGIIIPNGEIGILNWDSSSKRKLPSPGFQVEVVLIDYDGTTRSKPQTETTTKNSDGTSVSADKGTASPSSAIKDSESPDKDDVFSDNETEGSGSSKSRQTRSVSTGGGTATPTASGSETISTSDQITGLTQKTEQMTLENPSSTPAPTEPKPEAVDGAVSGFDSPNSTAVNDFKAMAADASVFTFGDEADYESD